MERIEIEDGEPTNAAHVIDRRDQFMLEQGGLVTKLKFDSVEEMSLDAFKRFVVPTMSGCEDSLTVVRDSAAGSYSFILGDGVAKLITTDVASVTT